LALLRRVLGSFAKAGQEKWVLPVARAAVVRGARRGYHPLRHNDDRSGPGGDAICVVGAFDVVGREDASGCHQKER
jgi:hypothetical protein